MPSDYQFYYHHTVIQSVVQECGVSSQDPKKKGDIKVHTIEGIPSDIKFTPTVTNDSFILRPSTLNKGDIVVMNRAYITTRNRKH